MKGELVSPRPAGQFCGTSSATALCSSPGDGRVRIYILSWEAPCPRTNLARSPTHAGSPENTHYKLFSRSRGA